VQSKAATVAQCLDELPPERRRVLSRLRAIVRRAAGRKEKMGVKS